MTAKNQHYLDLICRKIDKSTDAFVERVEARRRGEWERAEYLEKMIIEPLSRQINYLATKVHRMAGGRDI